MYVCLCCWLSAQATMYVSQEDATASPGIILIFVFVLSGICSLYSEHVETSPHNHHPYVCVVGYLPCSHCTWRMLKSHHISSSVFSNACVVRYLPWSHCAWRMLKLHHISIKVIIIHIFVFVLSGICPGHTVHESGGCCCSIRHSHQCCQLVQEKQG